ncbi:thymidine phosphorylase [Rosistilla oblonga]|uniref:thymidine phosphorylase n=1 Tax=Rosistilla oblonga TaxID=2527990 RepID=UPI003A978A8D
MIPAVLIAKKRDGHPLNDAEIAWFIEAFTRGEVSDPQMSAMAMAICLRGMTPQEISALTAAMLASGETLPRDSSSVPRVDKHSTGGLGDKVSLILAPLLACCDVQVPMISGRGLGLTGGTLDKLESIPGFRCNFDLDQSALLLKEVGCHIVSASERLAPADRRLYSLRDVTGTVESVALITASILSKKLAASLDALVMDVKVGSGAFMKSETDALRLANSLVETGTEMQLPVSALMTDMDQPLGRAVGNALEVNEVLDLLRGQGPGEVRELTLQLSAEALLAAKVCEARDQALLRLQRVWDDGSAMERFEKMIAAQGGRISGHLPVAAKHPIVAQRAGFVSAVECSTIGQCVVELGGGRRSAGDSIDSAVGVQVDVAIGERIESGQPLGFVFYSDDQAERWTKELQQAFIIADEVVAPRPLIIQRIESKKT